MQVTLEQHMLELYVGPLITDAFSINMMENSLKICDNLKKTFSLANFILRIQHIGHIQNTLINYLCYW